MIGFDLIGKQKSGSSVTRWEDSFFGGYYRTVMDYPEVNIDRNVDFDFGTLPYSSYYLKEKIMKIFLSKVKKHGLTHDILKDSKVERKFDPWGDVIIESTVSAISKKNAIRNVINLEPEFAPMFKHYQEFIDGTRIYFQVKDKSSQSGMPQESGMPQDKPEDKEDKEEQNESNDSGKGKSGKGKEEEKEKEKKEGGSGKSEDEEKKSEEDKSEETGGGQNSEENKSEEEKEKEEREKLEKELEDALEERKKELKAQKEKEKNTKLKPPTAAEIAHIYNNFKEAVNKVTEETIVYSHISGFNKRVGIVYEHPRTSETHFDTLDKRIADNLLKMLDISFDPANEIVKNLRLGKLDVAKIAEVPAGNISIYKQDVENQTTKPFSIVMLCDESGSMGCGDHYGSNGKGDVIGDKLYCQYRIVKQLYLAFSDILPQEKIHVYGHTGSSTPDLFVYQDAYRPNFTRTIDNMLDHYHSSNYDGPIIEEVYNQVRKSTNDRIIFIVLSDGQPAGRDYGGAPDILKMKQIIEKCKRDEFVTVGVGIQYFTQKDLYQYSTVITNLDDMAKKVSHIVNHVVKTEFQ